MSQIIAVDIDALPLPTPPFFPYTCSADRNELVIRIQPNEAMYMKVHPQKQPTFDFFAHYYVNALLTSPPTPSNRSLRR